jgi:hypothetical protein
MMEPRQLSKSKEQEQKRSVEKRSETRLSAQSTTLQSLPGTIATSTEQTLWRIWSICGPAAPTIGFAPQAYADDIVLIARQPEGIQKMLEVLEDFTTWTQMQLNVKKCATASDLRGTNRRRCSLKEKLMFKDQPIRNLTLGESLKYLATAVTA